MVKPVIFLLIILILLSLSSGLFFLFKDRGDGRGTMISLGIRVTLAALISCIWFIHGQLGNTVPWESNFRVYIRIETTSPRQRPQSANTMTQLQTQNVHDDQV